MFPSPTPAPTGAKETFLQRQRRLYGQQQTQQPQAPQSQPPQPSQQPATASGTSPVGADGRLTTSQPAQPQAPQAAPQPAGTSVPQATIPQAPQPVAPAPSQPLQQQTQDYAGYLMANPHTMSEENVAQMQAQQRDQAAILAREAAAQRAAQAASRGALGGGAYEAGERRASDALVSSILGANRDIALKKMEQDRQDELAALGAGQGVLQSQFDNFLKDRNFGLQTQLGLGGLNLDQTRLNEQGRQFDLGHGLDIQKFFENQRQFNADQGLRTADLQLQNQNAMMNWLRSVYGA